MDCLINHIGLRGCGQSDVASGYYINDLLSDALQQTSKLTTPEKATFIEIWNDIQKRAVRRFGVDVTNFLSKKYRLKRVTNSVNLGTKIELTDNQTAPSAEYRGLVIDLNPYDTCGNSALQVIHIQYLSVYLKAAGAFTARILDGHTLELLQSITITGIIGWNKLGAELDFDTTKLMIVYDATAVTSPDFELPEGACNCSCELGCESLGGCYDASIKGITSDATGILTTGTNTYGISGIFSVNCSYSGFVCNNKNLFTYSLWQLCGYMMMDERVNSSRLNQFTLVNIDQAKERKESFMTEYNRSLSDTLDGVDLCEAGDCCLECNEQIVTRESRM